MMPVFAFFDIIVDLISLAVINLHTLLCQKEKIKHGSYAYVCILNIISCYLFGRLALSGKNNDLSPR